MNPNILGAIGQAIASLVLASVWGVGSYALCRWLQRKLFNTVVIDIFLGLFWFISIPCIIEYVLPIVQFSVLFAIFSALCLLGGWFHKNSKAHTAHWFASTTVMAISCMMSVLGGALAMHSFETNGFWAPLFSFLYYAGLFLYPFLAPLALWIWQCSREAREVVRTNGPVAS